MRVFVTLGILALLACESASVVECHSSDDCPPGGLCVNSTCWLPCNADADCRPVESCAAGFCTPVLEPTCREHGECNTPSSCEHLEDARCVAGECVYEGKLVNTPCDDDNPCTAGDLCDLERNCVGIPVICNEPPPSECLANDTIFRTYASPGTCDTTDGNCVYPPADEPCPTCSQRCLACANHMDCAPSGYCSAEQECALRAADGGICTDIGDAACESGYCDGTLCCSLGDCCNIAQECPGEYASAPLCNNSGPDTECQGTRARAACTNHVCISEDVDDDSGCFGVVHTCPNNFAPVACTDELDQEPPACATSCSQTSECATGAVCDGSNCVPPAGLGASCTGAGQGTCEPNLKCENSVCCSVSSGTCCADPSPCTSGLGCNPLTDSCFVTCNDYDDSACADADSFCLSNACQPKLDDGATCVNRGECLSDHCDGVCCASSDCCTAPGDCPATYTIEPNCIVDPTECQGERFDPTCVDSQCGNTRIDDDSGCFGHQRDCANNFAPVVCTPESDQPLAICLTDCTTDGDCAAGHECAAPDCVVAPVLVPGDTTKVVARDGFEAQCIEWNGNSCTHAQIRPPIGEGPDTCAAFDGTSADWYDLAYCAAFVSNGDSAMWFCYFATGEIGNTNRTNTGVPIPDPYSFTHRFSASYSCIASPGGRTAWDSGVRGVHPDSDWVQVGYCDDSNRMAVECTGW